MAKDKATFHQEAMMRYVDAESYDRQNREAAVDDLSFYAGPGQWGAADRKAREGRPCLTVNQLPQFVAQVTGDMRQNAPSIRVLPAEDGDKDVAEVRTGLIRHIENASNATSVYIQAAELQVITGQGAWQVALDWADAESFSQDILIKAVSGPIATVWDPMSKERTGRDAEYVYELYDIPRKEFERKYPDKSLSPMTGDIPDGTGLTDWNTRDTIRLAAYWVMKDKPGMLYRDPQTGDVIDVTGNEEFKASLEAGLVDKADTRKTKKRYACRYLLSAAEILEGPYELPIDRVPIIRCVGHITDTGTNRYRWGLVRQAKDAQRLKNYWRSTAAELLALQPAAVWVADAKAVEGREDDFRYGVATADPLLIKNTGGELERIQPPAFPAAIHQEAQINTDDMKAVTGIYDSSLGARSNETSGKAILARERQGDVATYIYHDNLKASVQETGRLINQLIPIAYDTPRTIRVLGEDMSAKIQRINDPNNPESVDINVGKYDVVVSTGPSFTTKRVEAAESMMAFVQAVPAAGALVADLIASAQDWPMAEQFAKRLKAMLPPQAAQADDDEEPNEQQMQAMQMQQQQAQEQQQAVQAKMSADITKAQAEARQAEADAVRAEAEAMKAQIEAQSMAQQMTFAPDMIGQDQGAFDPVYSAP
jgi:hypothetical protein